MMKRRKNRGLPLAERTINNEPALKVTRKVWPHLQPEYDDMRTDADGNLILSPEALIREHRGW